jgi:molybdopterin-binding protein
MYFIVLTSAIRLHAWKAMILPILGNRSFFRRLELKISARNILKGKVVKVVGGAVNAEVTIELPGGTQLVSIITNSSVANLGLSEGKDAYAIIKASNVMVGVD